MYERREKKRYAAEKLGLLGLLVVAVLVARLIVAVRQDIKLSVPIELPYSSLSISIPSGNGWNCETQWTHRTDSFSLTSTFALADSLLQPQVNCWYLLAAEELSPGEKLGKRADSISGELAETEKTRSGNLTFDWAHIVEPKTQAGLFFAVSALSANRQLDVEVFYPPGETDLARKVLTHTLRAVDFHDNKLLHAGQELVGGIKRQGLETLVSSLSGREPRTFFLISDEQNRTVGFTMDILINSPDDANEAGRPDVRAATYYYLQGRLVGEQATLFHCDNNLTQFFWRIETGNPAGKTGLEMMFSAPMLTLRRLDTGGQKKELLLNAAAVPDVLFELALAGLLEGKEERLLLDMIKSDGTIVPVLVERLKPDQRSPQDASRRDGNGNYPFVCRTQLLDGRGFWQLLFFDEQKRLQKVSLKRESTYTLHRTVAERVLQLFPERADYIRHQEELL